MSAKKRETPLAGGAGATLIAKLALMGHSVYRLVDGILLVARWCTSRYCADASQLAGFLAQIGGRL